MRDIVGSWFVDVDGAPFRPHLMQFHEDGTFLSFNPSRVQEKPDGSGVNDSAGVGVWERLTHHPDRAYDYVLSFVELNAVQGTGTSVASLQVTAALRVSHDKQSFHAVAKAKLSDGTVL